MSEAPGSIGLLMAAECADAVEVTRLLKVLGRKKAREAEKIMGRTPLMAAAARGWIEGVELLAPVSDLGARDLSGRNALMFAAEAGHGACARLLAAEAEAAAATGVEGWTALMFAANNGSLECLEVLLPISDASRVDKTSGADALGHAAFNGRVECVRVLLRPRAPKRKKGSPAMGSKVRALMAALEHGKAGSVELLLPECEVATWALRAMAGSAVCWRPGAAEAVKLVLDEADRQDARDAARAEAERIGAAAGAGGRAKPPARRI